MAGIGGEALLLSCFGEFKSKRIYLFKISTMAIENKNRLLLSPRTGKWVIRFFLLAGTLGGLKAYQVYNFIFRANVTKDYVLYITGKTTFDMVEDSLETNGVMRSMKAFRWVARQKKCREYIKPGRYLFKEGMNANHVVNILRAGLQEPVNLIFNNIGYGVFPDINRKDTVIDTIEICVIILYVGALYRVLIYTVRVKHCHSEQWNCDE